MAEKESPQTLFRQESLERLSSPERLDELMTIVNLKAWLPLCAIGMLLGLGFLWSIMGRIPVTTRGRGTLVYTGTSPNELVALLYFDSRYRGQFQPGMPVILMPETLLSYSELGVMAQIYDIVEPPALTLDQARQQRQTLGNAASDQLEVLVALDAMAAAMPPDTIAPGVAVEGRITLEQKAPITFVFPFLER